MFHSLAPRHFGNVDETFDPGSEFDKSAVVGKVHDLAVNPQSRNVLVGHETPGIGLDQERGAGPAEQPRPAEESPERQPLGHQREPQIGQRMEVAIR